MKPKRADKKNFPEKSHYVIFSRNSPNNLIDSEYNHLFKVYTKSCTHVAQEYLSGLLQCEKGQGNMERMVEKVNNLIISDIYIFCLLVNGVRLM